MSRLFLFIAFLAALSGPARATVSPFDLGGNSSGAGTPSVTATVPSGALIVVITSDISGTCNAPTDGAGNTYSLATSILVTSGPGRNCIYYSANVSALSAQSISVNNGGGARATLAAMYATGIVLTSPVDVIGSVNGSGASPSVTSASSANSTDLFVGMFSCGVAVGSGNWVQSSGWSNIPSGDTIWFKALPSGAAFGAVGSIVVSTSGAQSYQPTTGATCNYGGLIVGFKANAASLAVVFKPFP